MRRLGLGLVSVCTFVALGACSSSDPPVPVQGDGAVVRAEKTPPALAGGTLLVTKHVKDRAVVSVPDRDQIWVVDLANGTPTASIDLGENDEPGRLVEDGAGVVHVALRRGGAIVAVDVNAGKILARTEVCAAPRGMAYDAATDQIHVACKNGELVTMPASPTAELDDSNFRTLQLERDLRDVMVKGSELYVTTFRKAELLHIDAKGKVVGRSKPPTVRSRHIRTRGVPEVFSSNVAWRTVLLPGGDFAMLHQRALDSVLTINENAPPTESAYGGGTTSGGGSTEPGCDPTILHTTISHGSADGVFSSTPSLAIPNSLLPIDLALHVDQAGRAELGFVAAGSNRVFKTMVAAVAPPGGDGGDTGCTTEDDGTTSTDVIGEPVALDYWGDLQVVQTRDPIAVSVLGNGSTPIELPGISSTDTGHDLFHTNKGGKVAVACASCHPEGGEDGHTWAFNTGPRRTQNVSNDVLTTAPFHWNGDMKDLGMIMHEVFEKRMGGLPKGPEHTAAISSFLGAIPQMANPIIGDPDAISRGDDLFHSEEVGCATCHAGLKFTNNKTENVGTGRGAGQGFQVPSLVGVVLRTPLMHTGCAATLHDRFDPACGGGDKHGKTSQLSPAQIDDLVAYLETL